MTPVRAIAVLSFVIAAPQAADHDGRSATLEVAAFSSDPGNVSLGADSGGDLRVDDALISFRNLSFRTEESCADRGIQAASGKIVAELVGGKLVGAPDHLDVTGAHYCSVELSIRRSAQRLGGASIVVHAHLADGTPLIVQSRMHRTLRLAAADSRGFTIRDGEHLALAADVAKWLGELDLANADVDAERSGRVIRIDGRSNRALLADFEDAVAAGLGLYDDVNGDGSLSEDERDGERRLAIGD